MKWPYALQGFIFAPAFVGLIFLLKALCPQGTGDICFADHFAVPVFMPLIALYQLFGIESSPSSQEFIFVLMYWAVVGFLIGLLIDLLTKKESKSSPPSFNGPKT